MGDFTELIRVKKQEKFSEITDNVATAKPYVCKNIAVLETTSISPRFLCCFFFAPT
jgi:hypothetical protein